MISDGKARRIASEWHGGQASALYSFVSTGATSQELIREVEYELATSAFGQDRESNTELAELSEYIFNVGLRGPVDGWARLWE